MSYTVAAVLAVLGSAVLDLAVLRTNVLARKAFWLSYVVVLAFEVALDGVLTGRSIVTYERRAVVGARFVHAPVEDLLFGFALVIQTCAWWVWWGRRGVRS